MLTPENIDLSKYRNGPQIRQEMERRGRPCTHLGRQVRSVDVPGCCGKSVTVGLHQCELHQQCTPHMDLGAEAAAASGLPPVHGCGSCQDWAPGES
jgi:hypothetical protein